MLLELLHGRSFGRRRLRGLWKGSGGISTCRTRCWCEGSDCVFPDRFAPEHRRRDPLPTADRDDEADEKPYPPHNPPPAEASDRKHYLV